MPKKRKKTARAKRSAAARKAWRTRKRKYGKGGTKRAGKRKYGKHRLPPRAKRRHKNYVESPLGYGWRGSAHHFARHGGKGVSGENYVFSEAEYKDLLRIYELTDNDISPRPVHRDGKVFMSFDAQAPTRNDATGKLDHSFKFQVGTSFVMLRRL